MYESGSEGPKPPEDMKICIQIGATFEISARKMQSRSWPLEVLKTAPLINRIPNPVLTTIRYTLGKAYEATGQSKKAMAQFQRHSRESMLTIRNSLSWSFQTKTAVPGSYQSWVLYSLSTGHDRVRRLLVPYARLTCLCHRVFEDGALLLSALSKPLPPCFEIRD